MKNEFIILQRMFLQEISDIKELGELKSLIEKIIDESTPSSELPTIIENIKSLTTSINAQLARESMLTLGRFYYYGIGVVRDLKQSFELFKKSHELGSLYAAVDLSTCYVHGLGAEANSVLGIKILEDAINKMPHCHAVGHLGSYYKNGSGVARNYNRAVKYLTEAVKKNNPYAANNLAIMYEDGLGVEQNKNKAFELYSLSAKLGYTLGKCHLGDCYRTGVGVEKCPSKAFQILLEAYNEDSPVSNKVSCAYYLAKCYQAGVGTPVDKKKAFDLFLESVTTDKSPRSDRVYTLGLCYELGDGVDSDQETALKYYEQAASDDYPDAIYKVGAFYLHGIGCKRDPIKAKAFLEKAADHNNVKAFVSLGSYYEIVETDMVNALHYYTLAYNKNDHEAPYIIGSFYEEGKGGVIKDKKKALKYYKEAVQRGYKDAISKVLELEKVLAEICENERRSPELESQRKGELQIQIEEYLRTIILQLQSQPDFNVESKLLSEKKEIITCFLLALSPLPKTCKDNQLFFDTRSLELLSPRAKKLLPNNIQFTFDEFLIFFSKTIADNVKDKNEFLQLLLNCSCQYQRYLASEGERKKRRDNEQMDSVTAIENELSDLDKKFENSFSENLMLTKLNAILKFIPEAMKNLQESNKFLSTVNFSSKNQQKKKGALLQTNARREIEITGYLNEINGLFREINKISKAFRVDHKINTQKIKSQQKGVFLESNTFLDTLKYYEQNCRLKVEKFNELYEIILNLQKKIAEDYTDQSAWPCTGIIFYQEKAMKSIDLEFRDLRGTFEVFKNLLRNKENIEKEVDNEMDRLAENQKFIERQKEERIKRITEKNERKKKYDKERKQEKKQEQKAAMLMKHLQKAYEPTLVSPKEATEASSRADWQGDSKGRGEKQRLEIENEARKNALLSELNSGDTRILFSQMMVPCKRRESACFIGEGERKERSAAQQLELSQVPLLEDSRSPSPISREGNRSPSQSSQERNWSWSATSSEGSRSPSPSALRFGYKNKKSVLSLSDLPEKCYFLDSLKELKEIFSGIRFSDIKTTNEITIVKNALLGICANAMESLKKVKGHGRAIQNIARNFRNVVYHCLDASVIPHKIKDDEIKSRKEWLEKELYGMVEALLSFLSSDKFESVSFVDATQVMEAIGSPLFSKIVSCDIRKANLQDCSSQLELGKSELNLYNQVPVLEKLKAHALDFTKARISTYACEMKKVKRWRKIFNELPDRILFEQQIQDGINVRHKLLCR